MSRFLKDNDDYEAGLDVEVNFEEAVPLAEGGSTCDLYRTRLMGRNVFVKRLKKELRSKPLYLDALEKEYQIGAGLKHPSLPTYLYFGRDYIVMDFIDGQTIADMLKHKDPWLVRPGNLERLLRQLVEVVGYLHRHNVVHCDIKPDNILISNNNRNLVLVDFDKSFTDGHSDTSGHPMKFDLPADSQGRAVMDFRGIALVEEAIKKAFPKVKIHRGAALVKACHREETDADSLLEILKPARPKKGIVVGVSVAVAAIVACLGVIVFQRISSRQPAQELAPVAVEGEKPEAATELVEVHSQPSETERAPESAIHQEDLQTSARKKAAELDSYIASYFKQLTAQAEALQKLLQDSTATATQLFDCLNALDAKEEEYFAEVDAIAAERFPEVTTERELWRIYSQSQVIKTYNRFATPLKNEAGLRLR